MFASRDTDPDYGGAITLDSTKYTTGTSRYGKAGGDYRKVNFDASRVVNTDTEVRPYSIYALPLIAY